jgi:glutathione S-transferase
VRPAARSRTTTLVSQRVLHQFTLSPYCIKIRKILEYKGLPYTTEEVNPFTRRTVVRLSGQKRVPVLVETASDGSPATVIADSTAIAQYLDACHPEPPIYPRDPEARARVVLLEDWSDEVFAHTLIPFKVFTADNARRMVVRSARYYPPTLPYRMLVPFGGPVVRRLAARRRRGRSLERLRSDYETDLARLDALAASSPFLSGAHPTVFDFAVWGLLHSMEGMEGEDLLVRRVSLAEWYERIEAIGR